MTASQDYDPPIGVPLLLRPGLRCITAPNPSPMTWRGTNTYLVGTRDIAVVDPGPDSPAHLQAILAALETGQRITHIIVTHTHIDHSPLARPLAHVSKAPVLAFGNAQAGRSAIMQQLAVCGLIGGGEGIDHDFEPDITLADQDIIRFDDWQLRVLHTPGHIGNHICLGFGDACLTADHVMGWASSLVSPPDGDLTDFMRSCIRLRAHPWRVFYPGHGAPVEDPGARLDWLISHRQQREGEILTALASGAANAASLADEIYADTPLALREAATRNVLAHLIDLMGKGLITANGALSSQSTFALL